MGLDLATKSTIEMSQHVYCIKVQQLTQKETFCDGQSIQCDMSPLYITCQLILRYFYALFNPTYLVHCHQYTIQSWLGTIQTAWLCKKSEIVYHSHGHFESLSKWMNCCHLAVFAQ